jgi:peptidoglycan/LPS O-acetylase OafA/YrhL
MDHHKAATGSNSESRNMGLDVLRATAILMVFLFHEISMKHIPLLGQFGTGVDLFFVLSGFLIGRIYFRTTKAHTFSLAGFWVARWWRTLPPYLAGLLLYIAVGHISSYAAQQPPLHWYYLGFLQNYLGLDAWGPTWSLCVEEQFYLSLPLVAFVIDRWLGRSAFRYLLPTVFFVPLVLRIILMSYAALPYRWYWMTHLHCEAMIAGLWLAYLFVEERTSFDRLQKKSVWLLPVIPATMLILPVLKGPMPDMVLFTLLAIGYAAWLSFCYGLVWEPKGRFLRIARWSIQHVALCAYSIYLTHTTVDPTFRGLAGSVLHLHKGMVNTSLVIVATLLVGIAFYHLVERPSIRTRDLYRSRRRLAEGTKPSTEPVGQAVLQTHEVFELNPAVSPE